MRAVARLFTLALPLALVVSTSHAAPFVVPDPILKQISYFKSTGESDLIARALRAESVDRRLPDVQN